ncbi:MAG: hypothetical protein NTZ13_01890 [Candidatus Parcubacteria bacterium]|nr:hypothetical protein [Candidatus Parcubacteria bacterium]
MRQNNTDGRVKMTDFGFIPVLDLTTLLSTENIFLSGTFDSEDLLIAWSKPFQVVSGAYEEICDEKQCEIVDIRKFSVFMGLGDMRCIGGLENDEYFLEPSTYGIFATEQNPTNKTPREVFCITTEQYSNFDDYVSTNKLFLRTTKVYRN